MTRTFITCLLVSACFTGVSDAETTSEYLTASDGAERDMFGYSVAVSGDYALVGASADDDRGFSSGSAYIFRREGSSWTEQTKLIATDGMESAHFGCSVALSGDYALVGAYRDSQYRREGSAYVFYREGISWTEQVKLIASNANTDDRFGCSVALSVDYALVGAEQDAQDFSGTEYGSAYVFYREGTSWTEQVKLAASDGEKNDNFGCSVALSGDYALVGAYGDDDKGDRSGSAYVFHHRGIWRDQAKLTARDGRADDRFGYSVALSGDYALVGAYGDDGKGAVYVFHREGSSWTEQAKLTARDGRADDRFGYSVALSGDYALVGAYGDDDQGTDSGSAYIFHREGTSWTQLEKIAATYGGADYRFGVSVALARGYAIVGSTGDDYNGPGAGSAHVFEFSVPGVPVVTDVTVEPNPVEQGQTITIRAKGAIR